MKIASKVNPNLTEYNLKVFFYNQRHFLGEESLNTLTLEEWLINIENYFISQFEFYDHGGLYAYGLSILALRPEFPREELTYFVLPEWMSSNLDSEDGLLPNSYWTLNALKKDFAWRFGNALGDLEANSSREIGIRPVITVLKSNL